MVKLERIPGCGEVFETEVTGFEQNSRDVLPGNLFFALKGKKVDGHDFLKEARERGAIAAVVSSQYQGEDFGLFLFHSEDVLASLQELAKQVCIERNYQIVAITGSVGKTTTKDFATTFLEKKYKVAKNKGSFNSQITLPLSILNADPLAEMLILEMGMSEKGEIKKLVDIAPPDVALITKISLAHAAFFEKGISEIADEKFSIFSSAKTKQALFHQHALEFQKEVLCPKLTFSLDDPQADFFLFASNDRAFVDEKGVRVADFSLPFVEKHMLEDFLAAASLARSLKLTWDEIISSIGELKIPKMRFEKIQKKEILFINDAYNANPESMKMALKSLPSPISGGKKIAVLGEMRELGAFSYASHEEIGKYALETVDHLLCLGKECEVMFELFKNAQKPAEIFFEKENLAERLNELMRPGDVVLIKGSRSLGLEKILDWII